MVFARPAEASLAAFRTWLQGVCSHAADDRYLSDRRDAGASARSVMGRVKRQLVAFATSRVLADLVERMFDEALAVLEQVMRMPAMGSPRLGQLCEIPGLRSWRVKALPMQWLYFEADDHLDVVRLVGDRQDIIAIVSVDA